MPHVSVSVSVGNDYDKVLTHPLHTTPSLKSTKIDTLDIISDVKIVVKT